jgi:hypothetical protein
VAANTSPTARLGDITLNDQHVAVSQAAASCGYDLAPHTLALPAAGGIGTLNVIALAGCGWTASSQAPWVQVTSATSGSGNGTLTFTVAANDGAVRVGSVTIGGQTFQVTQDAAAGPAPCTYSLDVTAQALGSAGGTASTTVRSGPPCSWTVVSNVPWMSIAGTSTGSGSGPFSINVAANTGSTRIGTATIAGQTFTVTQAGSCAASIAPASQVMTPAGGTGAPIAVTTDAGCTWSATTTDGWIALTAGSSGNGNGTVNFTVAATSGPPRTGTITIAGQTFTVTQTNGCAFAVNPASQSIGAAGGAGSAVGVSTGVGCAWTATTATTWLTVTSGASGNGNGTVNFTVAATSGPARTGTITIAGQPFTVNQTSGCAFAINPTSQSMSAAGGAGSPVGVTTAADCAWTATTAATWLTVTSGASGTGNATVNFTAAANSGPARTDTITIAGQTFTVNQANGCTYQINPTSQLIGSAGAGSAVGVSTADGCAWAASTATSWLTVTSGASGTGSGAVNFTAAANSGPPRTGTITIAGQTFSVTQTDGCAYGINPTSQSIVRNGGTGFSIAVTAGAGCAWTAVETDTWITITAGSSGTGNGTVTFSVASNPGNARTGIITIAGLSFAVNQQPH